MEPSTVMRTNKLQLFTIIMDEAPKTNFERNQAKRVHTA